ncbi:hypothetical protein F511_31750 [Dorcoceras hygrometricum]|uniref:Uncharacterized protein n=1 Tax=Dorcoceras hygrometricum TaxID=472368 RepID=A0A2Z7B5G2_9LAMI|nr:hypothetical protein F511_31750 [Dorcoceras hygrometricum]
MAASASQAYLCSTILTCKKSRSCQSFQVRAQSYRDEGRSSSIVDSNLRVLRERIQEVKLKERIERCYVAEIGWNYAPASGLKPKGEQEMVKFLEWMGMIGGTFGFTILSCTFCLYFISLLVQLNF